ncbi:MAG: NAD-dependent epimerase/dehydratase family protein [Bacteroidetes bacterium]|nr:NAD-dependent epimerase/dehydratase family protein [Bacteroidota bacterium]
MASQKKVKIIVTGATGMVGEGVLHVCLNHPEVDQVLIVNRRPSGIAHPKLKEIIHSDFFNLTAIENQLSGYDACLFCLGVSSVGMNEEAYTNMTHTLTTTFAQTVCRQNPNFIFCYISGASTDSTEQGRIMWARVKGKTENDLMKMNFKHVYNFRPSVMTPMAGMKNTLRIYTYFGWLAPLIKLIAPNSICKLEDLGKAMVNAVILGYDKQILEVSDIVALSKK